MTRDSDSRTADGKGQRMLDFKNRNGETGGGDAARFLICPAPPSA